MKRIVIFLKDHEEEALRTLADREYRDPRAQAALVIRDVLQQEGFLETEVENLEKENQKDEKKK